MKHYDLFIIAGEVSGDLHGEEVVAALKKKIPHLKIAGVAGPKMRNLGVECIVPMESFQVMGFIDVFLALPRLFKLFYQLKRTIIAMRPKAVLFIDYPGFNLRLAKSLKKSSFKGALCHYICPSVWIWGKKRIPVMQDVLDKLFTILPFEKEIFDPSKLDVQFVGHPLIERLENAPSGNLEIPKDKKLIALFPGSREKEILRNFPLQIKIAEQLNAEFSDLSFAISISHPRFQSILKQLIGQSTLKEKQDFIWVDGEQRYALMQKAHAAIAKSGTVTLELALHQIPTVVMYAVTPLDKWIAYDVLRIRPSFYCLVNLIAKEEVYPELIGPNLTEETLYRESKKMLFDTQRREHCMEQCKKVHFLLGEHKASEKIAEELSTKAFRGALKNPAS